MECTIVRRSSEEGYAFFRWIANLVTKHYKLFVLLWALAFAGALVANQIWNANDVISFSQAASLPEDTPSAQAQRIIEQQFPGRVANDSATIVLVANDSTSEFYRWFASDLNDAIVSASQLGPGQNVTMRLRIGGNLTISERIEYMMDASNATIWNVYENLAYNLAKQLNGPVHLQVTFTESAAGIYWGLPASFLGTWLQTPPVAANATAYSATRAFINSTFPAQGQPWADASFDTFYREWRASFTNPITASLTPDARVQTAIDSALPIFLDSPFANATFPVSQKPFQLGMLSVFTPMNFLDHRTIVDYALSAFNTVTVARPPFFQELYANLPENANDSAIHAFAKDEALAYNLSATPLVLPVNVTRFYVSPDHRILLMAYEFTEGTSFTTADKRQPVKDDVLTMRNLVAKVKTAYGIQGAVYVTGNAPSTVDSERIFGGGAEFIATIVLVIVLIGLYFRSAVSPTFPILTIAIALMLANLFVYFVAVYLFSVDFTVTAVLETVLLAVGTDYSIFLVSRYRDERQDGRDRQEAVRNAVIWAGESVTTSGGAVMISFLALSLGTFPLLRSMGLTLGAAVTLALAIALTFIPSVLMLLGNRVFWPSGKRVTRKRPHDKAHWTATERYFHRAATTSMKHAKIILVAAVLITLPAMYVVLTDQPTYDFSAGAPVTESSQGLDAISASFGYGFVLPTDVIVQFPSPVLLSDGNVSVASMEAVDNLTHRIVQVDSGVKSVESPTDPQGASVDYRNLSTMNQAQRDTVLTAMKPYIGKDNATVRLVLVLTNTPFSREALATVDRLRNEIPQITSTQAGLSGATVYVGGVSAVLNDVRHSLDHDLQIMAVVVITGLFIVLLFVLGSVLIPIRAILTILLSISWTLALTITLFHLWMDLDVIFILTLALFVMAMGLGMDYDIFIITRVREEVAKGKSDPEAIAEATTRTGGIISACGIVMAGAFFTLMLSPSPLLKEIGFALAFAILLDSMVVRIYLVPAIMVLAGKYNWWAPGPLQRVRREDKASEAARANEPEDPKGP
jgi:RND superfamily putative drug exporter